MSSIAVKRLALVVSTAFALGGSATALAGQADTEAGVVARLYKDFAWEALAGQPDLFGEGLAHQDKATLEKYFAPALARLLLKDAACQARYQGICNLDFDILFDSQDPRVSDLEVEAMAPGTVSVVYKDPVSDRKTQIDFEVGRTAGRWKITDVIYRKPERTSLKQVLLNKVPPVPEPR